MIVDRIEGEFAVVELSNGDFVDIPIKDLYKGVREGDVLKVELDLERTATKKNDMQSRIDALIRKQREVGR